MANKDIHVDPQQGHEYKDQQNVRMPGQSSQKKRTTIGQLAKRDHKELVDVEQVVEQSQKQAERIHEVAEQEKKEQTPIEVDIESVRKTEKNIEEVVPSSTKEGEEIPAQNHTQKTDVRVDRNIESSEKTETEIPTPQERPPKEETIDVPGHDAKSEPEMSNAPEHEQRPDITTNIGDPERVKTEERFDDVPHTSKTDLPIDDTDRTAKEEVGVEDRDHESKSEEIIEDKDHEAKSEVEVPETERDNKVETPLEERDHDSKDEVQLEERDHETKDELQLEERDHRAKEEISLEDRDHNAKSEIEIGGYDQENFDRNEPEIKLDHSSPKDSRESLIQAEDGSTYDSGTGKTPQTESLIQAEDGSTYETGSGKDDRNTEDPVSTPIDRITQNQTANFDFESIPEEQRNKLSTGWTSGDGYQHEAIADSQGETYQNATKIIDGATQQSQINFDNYDYDSVLEEILGNYPAIAGASRKTSKKVSSDINNSYPIGEYVQATDDEGNLLYNSDGTPQMVAVPVDFTENINEIDFNRRNVKVARDEPDHINTEDDEVGRDPDQEDADIRYGEEYNARFPILTMFPRYDLISFFVSNPNARLIALKSLRIAEDFGAQRLVEATVGQLSRAISDKTTIKPESPYGMHAFDVSRKLFLQTLKIGYNIAKESYIRGKDVNVTDSGDPEQLGIAKTIETFQNSENATSGQVRRASRSLGRAQQNIDRGFIGTIMKPNKIYRSAGHIFGQTGMIGYLTALYELASANDLANVGGQLDSRLNNLGNDLDSAIEERDEYSKSYDRSSATEAQQQEMSRLRGKVAELRRKKRSLEETKDQLSRNEKAVLSLLHSLLPPGEPMPDKSQSAYAGRNKDAYWDVDLARSPEAVTGESDSEGDGLVPGTQMTWRQFKFQQRLSSEEDLSQDSWANKRQGDRKNLIRKDVERAITPDSQEVSWDSTNNEFYHFMSFLLSTRFAEHSYLDDAIRVDQSTTPDGQKIADGKDSVRQYRHRYNVVETDDRMQGVYDESRNLETHGLDYKTIDTNETIGRDQRQQTDPHILGIMNKQSTQTDVKRKAYETIREAAPEQTFTFGGRHVETDPETRNSRSILQTTGKDSEGNRTDSFSVPLENLKDLTTIEHTENQQSLYGRVTEDGQYTNKRERDSETTYSNDVKDPHLKTPTGRITGEDPKITAARVLQSTESENEKTYAVSLIPDSQLGEGEEDELLRSRTLLSKNRLETAEIYPNISPNENLSEEDNELYRRALADSNYTTETEEQDGTIDPRNKVEEHFNLKDAYANIGSDSEQIRITPVVGDEPYTGDSAETNILSRRTRKSISDETIDPEEGHPFLVSDNKNKDLYSKTFDESSNSANIISVNNEDDEEINTHHLMKDTYGSMGVEYRQTRLREDADPQREVMLTSQREALANMIGEGDDNKEIFVPYSDSTVIQNAYKETFKSSNDSSINVRGIDGTTQERARRRVFLKDQFAKTSEKEDTRFLDIIDGATDTTDNRGDERNALKKMTPQLESPNGTRGEHPQPFNYNALINYPQFQDTVNVNAGDAEESQQNAAGYDMLRRPVYQSESLSDIETVDLLTSRSTREFRSDTANSTLNNMKSPIRINRQWSETTYGPIDAGSDNTADRKQFIYKLADGAQENVVIYEPDSEGKAQTNKEQRYMPENSFEPTVNIRQYTKDDLVARVAGNRPQGAHESANLTEDRLLGYIAAMADPSASSSSWGRDRTKALWTIPFQFDPEISGEDRSSNWVSTTAFGRSNEHYTWANTGARGLQFKTTIAITSNGEFNPTFPWATNWTEEYVLQILNRYRALVTPISYADDDLPSTPPVIAIIRSPNEIRYTKQSDLKFSRWVVMDYSIEPRLEAGYQRTTNTPRAWDINLTLKEVYHSWRDSQDALSIIDNYPTTEIGNGAY